MSKERKKWGRKTKKRRIIVPEWSNNLYLWLVIYTLENFPFYFSHITYSLKEKEKRERERKEKKFFFYLFS